MTRVVNTSKRKYLIDVEHIITRILQNIPDKYKYGLEEIRLIEGKRETDLNPEYHLDSESNKAYVKLYLEDISHTSLPLLSRLFINMSIVLSIEDHYKEYLSKKFQADPSFQSKFNIMNALYCWGELGIGKPVFWLYWKIKRYKT